MVKVSYGIGLLGVWLPFLFLGLLAAGKLPGEEAGFFYLVLYYFMARYGLGAIHKIPAALVLTSVALFLIVAFGLKQTLIGFVFAVLAMVIGGLGILFGFIYVVVNPGALVALALPEVKLSYDRWGIVLRQVAVLWVSVALTVAVDRWLATRITVGYDAIHGWEFGALSWLVLLLPLFLVLSWLAVQGLVWRRIGFAMLGLPVFAFFDTLTSLRVLPTFCLLTLIGSAGVTLWIKQKETPRGGWMLGLTLMGVSALAGTMTEWATSMPLAYLLSLVVLLGGLHAASGGEPIRRDALIRWLSPLHSLYDLCLPLLRRLDGPGPRYD